MISHEPAAAYRRDVHTLADFDALSFDCYGTLIDWEAGLSDVLVPWAREQGLSLDAEALLAGYAGHEARVEAEHPDLLYPDVLATSLAALGEQLGAPVSQAAAADLGSSVGAWPAFVDSPPALARLAENYKLIILSNVDPVSFAASNARLGVTFDLVLTAAEIGSYKPAPRNFEVLLARTLDLGIAPGRLLHVAQSLFHDHVPAQAAGLETVWIDRRHDRHGSGATPVPTVEVTPTWRFESMEAFASAAAEDMRR